MESVVAFRNARDLASASSRIVAVVRGEGVLVFPTETYYGLGGDPASARSVERIVALKARPSTMALPVLAADWAQIDRLVEVGDRWRDRLEAVWPGSLTAVLPIRQSMPASAGNTLAVRIPGHPLLRELLVRTGPLTGTSANGHGEPPSANAVDALASLRGFPDLILDGGSTAGGAASTLVDLSGGAPRILRQGRTQWPGGES